MASSAVSFALDLGTLALLTEVFGLFYLLSAAVSFSLGTTLSYLLSVLWVFGARRVPSKALEYGLFFLIGIVGLGLNEALLWLFTEKTHLYYLYSKIAAGALVFFWNFGARKYVLFRSAAGSSSQ
jgi:putative flippase GtrA